MTGLDAMMFGCWAHNSPYLPLSAWPFVASEVIVSQCRCPRRYQRPAPNEKKKKKTNARPAAEYGERVKEVRTNSLRN